MWMWMWMRMMEETRIWIGGSGGGGGGACRVGGVEFFSRSRLVFGSSGSLRVRVGTD